MNREEAIKVLNSRPYTGEVREALEILIPELKESEDERIRKWLVNYFTEIGENWIHREFTCEQIIAYLEKQKEHQNNSDAPNESSWAGMISSLDKDKNLDEIAQDYVDGVKEYNPEPTWDLIQTAVCYGYHFRANHQVLDDKHLLSAIQVQFASHAKVENGKRYAKLTWDEFKKIVFELYSCEKQKEQKQPHHLANSYSVMSPKEAEDEMVKLMLEGSSNPKQKPAEWNEEDNIGWEEAFACVTRTEKAAKNEEELQNAVTAEKWLKEIKFKYYVHHIKQEWSEEDENIIDTIVSVLGQYIDYKAVSGTGSGYATPRYSKEIAWLNSLRPQSKIHYWTEEEIEPIISDYLTGKEHYGGMIARLRCLKPKSHWKPSEEQMEALHYVKQFDYGGHKAALVSLYEQLKALM